ncbi:MAG TPA: FecR family protein [Reyranella sp.]|nr:FecR family protein [Reyranella sp.]
MPSPFAIRTILATLTVAAVGLGFSPAHARVGVTSQTDGDPVGRPPAAVERVLRVGIDIQANEVITTKADDRAHVVFLDGTSLTVGPDARLVIDSFVYDAATKKGDLAISVSKGVLRLVGGKVSKTAPMVVTTPSATVGIRGGIGLMMVDADETKAFFLFGQSMTVSANGRTEKATRAGSQIVTRLGGLPGIPQLASSAELARVLASFDRQGGSKGDTADRKAKESGFSSSNSDKAGAGGQPSSAPSGAADQAYQALSNADLQRQATMPNAGAVALGVSTPSAPSSGPLSGPLPGPLPGPSPLPAGPTFGAPPSPTAGPSPSVPPPSPPSVPPPSVPPTQGHRATPATGVGNGGLTPAIPAGPSQGRR